MLWSTGKIRDTHYDIYASVYVSLNDKEPLARKNRTFTSDILCMYVHICARNPNIHIFHFSIIKQK